MVRVVLTAKQKRDTLAALSAWDHDVPRRARLEALATTAGVHAKEAYTTVMHLDTLHALGADAPLVWKGGTAIQSYLPPDVQRISTDLDFNSTTKNTEILRESIDDANSRLTSTDSIVAIKGVEFGRFYEADHREEYKTIEFRRVLPTIFDELVTIKAGTFADQDDDVRIQGRLSRVQINYGHHELPALHPERAMVSFFTQPELVPKVSIEATRASTADLLADKILATTRHDGFGRERFKDLYDLIALRHLGTVKREIAAKKLGRIIGPDRVPLIVEGSLDTLTHLGTEPAVQGFANMVCHGGKQWLRAWDTEIDATVEWLMPLTEAR